MSVRSRVDSRVVETSLDGRYERFDEKLGSGAYKDVWLAYDTETGKEGKGKKTATARLLLLLLCLLFTLYFSVATDAMQSQLLQALVETLHKLTKQQKTTVSAVTLFTVAWNTVALTRLPAHDKKRITFETEILASLSHPHIINFYHVWMTHSNTPSNGIGSSSSSSSVVNDNSNATQMCFTTEIMTSGTLKQYIARIKGQSSCFLSYCR